MTSGVQAGTFQFQAPGCGQYIGTTSIWIGRATISGHNGDQTGLSFELDTIRRKRMLTGSPSGVKVMDEFYELTLPEEKIQELIGTEFDELILEEGSCRAVISGDIIRSFFSFISGGAKPACIKETYDEEVHELYRSIRKQK